jgi:hypothetical protein
MAANQRRLKVKTNARDSLAFCILAIRQMQYKRVEAVECGPTGGADKCVYCYATHWTDTAATVIVECTKVRWKLCLSFSDSTIPRDVWIGAIREAVQRKANPMALYAKGGTGTNSWAFCFVKSVLLRLRLERIRTRNESNLDYHVHIRYQFLCVPRSPTSCVIDHEMFPYSIRRD